MTSVQASSSWLFIRHNETVRIFRPGPPYLQLAIAGPQGHRRMLRFDREADLQAFQRDHEQQLINEGWHLEGVDVERRSGGDRRGKARGGPDRRIPDSGGAIDADRPA